MFDLLRNGVIDSKKVKVFVLDEADVMMDRQGLGDQSIKIKKYCSYIEIMIRGGGGGGR
jgi:ATP-dependent RNA helicase DDX19/DBP5